jgi:hypothetical protein
MPQPSISSEWRREFYQYTVFGEYVRDLIYRYSLTPHKMSKYFSPNMPFDENIKCVGRKIWLDYVKR